MAEVNEIEVRGVPYLHILCDCGQKQRSPKPASGTVKCNRCGAAYGGA